MRNPLIVPELSVLVEGAIVVPYMKGAPVLLQENPSGGDNFIRAQLHPHLKLWYSEVDNVDISTPRISAQHHGIGAVVFVAATELRIGQGIKISRVMKEGKSARGVVIDLPTIQEYPYDYDTGKLFKSVKE